jgi:hypothetical protein
VTATYRPPGSFRPIDPLGGHSWLLDLDASFASCTACYSTVPLWALGERFWMVLAGRWCMGVVRALNPPTGLGQGSLFEDAP